MMLTEIDHKIVVREFKHYLNGCEAEQVVGLVEIYQQMEQCREIFYLNIPQVRFILRENVKRYVEQKNCCQGVDDDDLRLYYTARIREIEGVLQNM